VGDDSTSMVIKLAVLGVLGYLGYQYLQNSGLWAQWFGGGVQNFTDPTSLLTWCNANPTLSATYNGQSGTCQQWIQASAQTSSSGSSSSASTSTTTSIPAATSTPSQPAQPARTSTPPTGYTLTSAQQNLVNQLISTGKVSASTLYNVWQWNYVLNELTPGSTDLNTPNNAQTVTASQYVAWRAQYGLSGLEVSWRAPSPYSQVPYKWVM